ncbi:HPr kinase/phosphorylase [Methylobacterium gregans]|uniref:HPr kinase/phosphorylase n=1 Tax=Methylobacterium gregans TaxID=374424 RepID=UPI00360B9F77
MTAHATCVVLGEAGVLIRGESGAGKSSLALALLDRSQRVGNFAAFVADDRVRLERHHDRLVARPHPRLSGLIEVRSVGIRAVADLGHAVLPACVTRLAVDLVASSPRLPEPEAGQARILGLDLPRLVVDRRLRDSGLVPALVFAALFADAVGRPGVASQPHSTTAGSAHERGRSAHRGGVA